MLLIEQKINLNVKLLPYAGYVNPLEMESSKDRINLLSQKLEFLLQKHEAFKSEIFSVKKELEQIKNMGSANEVAPNNVSIPESDQKTKLIEKDSIPTDTAPPVQQQQQIITAPSTATVPTQKKKKSKSNFERFIGENLINKIGIIILVIGVSIGAKYAIDNEMIGPTMRILLGYLLGLGLLGFAIKLKKKYEGFSAVLLSGAFAIMYFITFAAYSFYELFPQTACFTLLIFFTIATVVAAIGYNKQVIAHIGLVGAYAIPFLLSNNSGNITFMFTYATIINLGLLTVAVLRYWKLLFLSAFSVTWIIFLGWYIRKFAPEEQVTFAFTFLIIFFVIFFTTFIINKLINNKKFGVLDILLLSANSFVFYGIGASILNSINSGKEYIGLFTLINGVIHFVVAFLIYKKKLADSNLFYLLSGMVLIFLTITFPVQFDGGWVTIFWAGEATILFWIGRSKSVKIYEYLSYPLILLAFGSLIQDWSSGYNNYILNAPETRVNLFLNITFLTSLIVIGAFSAMYIINRNKNYLLPENSVNSGLKRTMSVIIPIILIVISYFAIQLEFSNYWNQLHVDSEVMVLSEGTTDYTYPMKNNAIETFKVIWLLNFTMLFMAFLSIFNIALKNNKIFGWIIIGFNSLILFIFLAAGLYGISELRDNYLDKYMAEYFTRDMSYLTIRYFSYLFVALLLISTIRLHSFLGNKIKIGIDLIITGSLLWLLSSELLHWFNIAEMPHTYKIGLSIFWGLFALLMVVYGIAKRTKHIRIAAFGILGFTLLKLFFYDLSHMTPISRAIIFILLGILMLGVSFLYNKYKNIISDEA